MSTKPKEAKPIKSGTYNTSEVEVEAIKKKTVIPYEDIETALKAGKIYVLPIETSKNTVAQAVKRIRTKLNLPLAKVGKTKATHQYVFYV